MRRIYAEGIATGNATFETEVPDRRTLDHAWLPDHRWVAELDGHVVGWAAASRSPHRPVYAGVAETSLYVGDGYRGRGVGKALIHHQVTAADTAGLWTLQTAIFPENRASIALHQSAGFRTLGVRERIGRHHGAGATPSSSNAAVPTGGPLQRCEVGCTSTRRRVRPTEARSSRSAD